MTQEAANPLLQRVQGIVGTYQQKLAEEQALRTDVETKYQTAQSDMSTLQDTAEQLRGEKLSLEERCTTATRDLSAKTTEYASLQTQQMELTTRYTGLETQYQELRRQNVDAEGKVTATEEANLELQIRVEELQGTYTRAEQQNSELHTQIQHTQKQIDEVNRYLDSLKLDI